MGYCPRRVEFASGIGAPLPTLRVFVDESTIPFTLPRPASGGGPKRVGFLLQYFTFGRRNGGGHSRPSICRRRRGGRARRAFGHLPDIIGALLWGGCGRSSLQTS